MSWSLVPWASPLLTWCRDSCFPWVWFSIRIFADQAVCSTHCNLRGRDLREKHSSDSRPQVLMWNYLFASPYRAFISIASKEGLWVILCPGPYIGSDLDLGGLPRWVVLWGPGPGSMWAPSPFRCKLQQSVFLLFYVHGFNCTIFLSKWHKNEF